MIKVQEFAKQQGVTDRQVQRLIKKYEPEIAGHFERRGQQGTWLDDEACDFLRSKMKATQSQTKSQTKSEAEPDIVALLKSELEFKNKQIEELQRLLDQAQQLQLIAENKVAQLEAPAEEKPKKRFSFFGGK